jgi:hypothetical protein
MTSDTSPAAMARDLVARHSDIGFIRGYIVNFFGEHRAPSREKIAALRADFLAYGKAVDDRRKVEECSVNRSAIRRVRYHTRKERAA